MAVPLSRYRFTVAEYEAMGKVGILGEDARDGPARADHPRESGAWPAGLAGGG
jgi:hypothetical protein